MSGSNGATSVSDLVDHIGDAPDVRALLDLDPLPVSPSLVTEIKREIDRLAYADRASASRLVEAAAWAADRLGDGASRAFADASRARLLYAEARYGDAEPLFAAATSALRDEGRPADAAALAKQHMETLMYLGRYDEAFVLAREARGALRRLGDRRLLAEHETNTGNVYYRIDRYRKALGCYERARAIFREIGEPLPLAYVDHNCATALVDLDRADEALDLYARASETYRDLGLKTLALQVELAVAFVEYLKGHYHEALRRFHAAQESSHEILNDADAALTDLDLAAVYLHMNALPEAADAARRAAEGFAKVGMARELAGARRLVAVAAARSGDETTAAEVFDEVARALDQTSHPVQAALTRLERAAVALHRGEWRTAHEAASAAAEPLSRAWLAPKRRRARLLEARALFGLGETPRATRLARATLRSAEAAGDAWVAYQCHHLLARGHAAAGRRPAALAAYRAAIDAVERLRSRIVVDDFKTRFLEDKVDLYESAVETCLEGGTPELVGEALRTLELAKSRSLTDLLSGYLQEYLPGAESGRDARERFKRLVDELAWYSAKRDRAEDEPGGDGARREARRRNREIEACEARIAEAFQRLQVEDARFAELQTPHVVDPTELQALVGPNEAIVEFVAAGGEYSAIVVTNEGLGAVRHLAPVARVDSLLESLRFQMDKFLYGADFAGREIEHLRRGADLYLAKLYDCLLRPLERHIGDRNVVFVPHGKLHYAPLHALFDGEAYVVERRAVSYAPSATVYALCAPGRNARDRRAGGAPLLCGMADASAPEIAREIDALRALFPSARVLTGADATREAVAREAEACGILHIASHAVFRADNPMLSSLRLADGDLTFYDVFNLRLSADLVVLSGCNTGTVAVGAGDELHGLMRGFLYAGAPALLISMWAADDATTASLMRTFYTELQKGSSKRDALRTAQREAIDHCRHPYYWAPFTLLGRAV